MKAIRSRVLGAGSETSADPPHRYRVLTIASHPVQYAAPIFRRLAQQPQLDFHVAYCSLRGVKPSLDRDFGQEVQWDVPLLDGYDWVHVANRGSGDGSFWGLRNSGLWKLIRKGKFEAVSVHLGYRVASFWIAYLAARTSGAAFLFGTDATSLAPRDGRAWKRVFKQLTWPWLFRLADQICAPSSAGVELMRSLGFPEERISLTHFVVDNDWWNARAAEVDRDAVRAAWGVSKQELVVLFCAKLQSWKRPLDLLRAFGSANVPDAVLAFAGEGALRAQIEAEAAQLGVTSRLRMLGFLNQSELPAAYTSADLFVLPSEYDPCPVVVCEAMICGLPVLLSDRIRGRFDLVQAGVTGDIFPCGDVQALAASLVKLLSDRAKLGTMRENARRRMTTWSPRQNVAGTVEAFARAVRRRCGTAAGPDASVLPSAPPSQDHAREAGGEP